MGLQRRYKILFTQETITDEGAVVKEKAPIQGQICVPEEEFQRSLMPETLISEIMIEKLCLGLKQEIKNPNHQLDNEKQEEIVNEEPEVQTITPLIR